MYKPLFNTVLVEINDKEAAWGKGNDENIGGEVYHEGVVRDIGGVVPTSDYPIADPEAVGHRLMSLNGKTVMWNEGHEAGTTFDEDGKKYGLIYWWDLRGVKDEQ